MRGATLLKNLSDAGYIDFNSHAPCGARRSSWAHFLNSFSFQLTRPMRGATVFANNDASYKIISTHTPHAGRDATLRQR